MSTAENAAEPGMMNGDEEVMTGLIDDLPASSPKPRAVPQTLKGDLSGALLAAVISVSESIPYGMLVFAPLGAAAASLGVLSGLYASIFAALIAALFGGTQNLLSGPRAVTAVIAASMATTLAHAPDLDAHGGVPMAMALVFLGISLAGLLQITFGWARLGRLIKFTPYPVIAGFMNGVAVLVLISQTKFLLGLPGTFKWSAWRDIPHLIQPWTVLVAAVTTVFIVLGPRITRHMPSLVVGLAAGIVTYYVIADQLGLEVLGPTIGDIPDAMPSLDAFAPIFAIPFDNWLLNRLLDLAPAILVLAVIASIDSLMGAAALDSVTHGRHNGNKELMAQGLSNVVSGITGGLASSSASARSAAAYYSGARTRMAGVAHSLIVLTLTLAAGPWIGTVPRAVMAAVLTVVAVGKLDSWSRELLARLHSAGEHRREIAANLAVVIAVAAVTVAVDLITAVAVGTLIAMLLFVTQMSKSIVRRVYDGRARRSLKVRERHDAELLNAHGDEVVIIELDGPLFFGTADALLSQAERGGARARIVILDFRRVPELDATGIRLLQVLAESVSVAGRMLLLAHITPTNEHGRFITAIGGRHLFANVRCFADTDMALEWAEDWLMERYTRGRRDARELALTELCLADGCTPEELDLLGRYVKRRVFKAGDVLFREGAAGDALYMLAQGSVTIRLARRDGGAIRLATLIPGVMFGEMALLEDQNRSADAVATTDIAVFEMSRADYAAVLAEHPALAAKLIANMARAIASRLRVTSDHLRAVS